MRKNCRQHNIALEEWRSYYHTHFEVGAFVGRFDPFLLLSKTHTECHFEPTYLWEMVGVNSLTPVNPADFWAQSTSGLSSIYRLKFYS